MSRYKVYPEYKDSGVQWLGNIPLDWEVSAIKRIAMVVNGATPKSTEEAFWDGDIPWITPADLGKDSSPYIRRGSRSITRLGYESCGTSMVPVGTIILASRAPIGTLGIATSDLCTNQGCKSLIAKEIHNKFLYYVLLISKTQLNLLGRGTTFLELSADELGAYEIAFPNGEIQKKIANFLDHETAKIDTLIAKQQELIKLLKEKRQAVISHAVTKGLNPNAPMRDSGVEWLGEVPAHWWVVPMKLVCEVKDGTHDTPIYVDKDENAFPLITSKDFFGGEINFESAKYISKFDHLEIQRRSNTENGDVLMSMIGGNIGKALIVNSTESFSIKNVALFKTNGSEDLANFILFYLQSGLLDVQISILSRGGAQGFLSLGDLRNLVFFKVPEEELSKIVQILKAKVLIFDEMIARSEKAIELLQERRTTLISAAVTGKIDVRDWQPPSEAAVAA